MEPTPDKNDKHSFDLGKILLPKKEARTSASAERVNAGALLEQEQHAELEKEKKPEVPPPPKKPNEEKPIAPLQTYQSDIESVIEQKNVSAVSIATAEAERRGGLSSLVLDNKPGISTPDKTLLIIGGVTLVAIAIAGLLYALFRPAPSVEVWETEAAPLIAVDDTRILLVPENQWNRNTVMQSLESIRNGTSISLGLMARSYVAVSTSTDASAIPPPVTMQKLLALLAPNTSDELRRSLDADEYVLGVHVFDGNQSFLIVRTDSYEQTFSGMLAWERTMRQELLPLFDRSPRPRLPEEQAASSTPQTQTFQTPFIDRIVENHDARVVENEFGDILLLWTFLNRSTLVITTNDATLRELVSRYNSFTPAD